MRGPPVIRVLLGYPGPAPLSESSWIIGVLLVVDHGQSWRPLNEQKEMDNRSGIPASIEKGPALEKERMKVNKKLFFFLFFLIRPIRACSKEQQQRCV